MIRNKYFVMRDERSGTVKAFIVAFGRHVINGAGLPMKFKAGDRLRLFAP